MDCSYWKTLKGLIWVEAAPLVESELGTCSVGQARDTFLLLELLEGVRFIIFHDRSYRARHSFLMECGKSRKSAAWVRTKVRQIFGLLRTLACNLGRLKLFKPREAIWSRGRLAVTL